MRDPSAAGAILEILRSLAGVRSAVEVPDELRRKAVELESAHERSSVLPVRNLGVRLLADRAACFAILKDGTFRPPASPRSTWWKKMLPRNVCTPWWWMVGGMRW